MFTNILMHIWLWGVAQGGDSRVYKWMICDRLTQSATKNSKIKNKKDRS